MTTEQKREYWQKNIEAWKQSQLTQSEYCNQHNLSLASFGIWRTRINRSTHKNTISTDKKLIPVNVSRSSMRVNLYLPFGIRLEVPADALENVLPVVYRNIQVSS